MRYSNQVRVVRKGVLDPKPLDGLPVMVRMFDIVAHPKFAENKLVYFNYAKNLNERETGMALARARYDGSALSGVQDLYVSNPVTQGASRMAFAPDVTLYMTVSGAAGRTAANDPRKLDTTYGKVIRLRDDGTVPPDNPFVGKTGARPEIYTQGHRDHFGIAPHPTTGQMFHVELGPYGGDTVHILNAGVERYIRNRQLVISQPPHSRDFRTLVDFGNFNCAALSLKTSSVSGPTTTSLDSEGRESFARSRMK